MRGREKKKEKGKGERERDKDKKVWKDRVGVFVCEWEKMNRNFIKYKVLKERIC